MSEEKRQHPFAVRRAKELGLLADARTRGQVPRGHNRVIDCGGYVHGGGKDDLSELGGNESPWTPVGIQNDAIENVCEGLHRHLVLLSVVHANHDRGRDIAVRCSPRRDRDSEFGRVLRTKPHAVVFRVTADVLLALRARRGGGSVRRGFRHV